MHCSDRTIAHARENWNGVKLTRIDKDYLLRRIAAKTEPVKKISRGGQICVDEKHQVSNRQL
jgi:hypothetical protein